LPHYEGKKSKSLFKKKKFQCDLKWVERWKELKGD
jgi:hypothetical protein